MQVGKTGIRSGRQRKLSKGFTLIEVVVSLTIFAISMLVLTQSFVNGLHCKASLSQENQKPIILQMIRSALMQINRDQVGTSNVFFLPDYKTQIEWDGKVSFCNIPNLYCVEARIKSKSGKSSMANELFFIHRPDWMTSEEMAMIRGSKE